MRDLFGCRLLVAKWLQLGRKVGHWVLKTSEPLIQTAAVMAALMSTAVPSAKVPLSV